MFIEGMRTDVEAGNSQAVDQYCRNDSVLTAKRTCNLCYDARLPGPSSDVVVLPKALPKSPLFLKLQMKIAFRNAAAIRTNISGGSVPICGGMFFVRHRMNRILEINKANLTAAVEAGRRIAGSQHPSGKRKPVLSSRSAKLFSCTVGGTVGRTPAVLCASSMRHQAICARLEVVLRMVTS